MLQDRDRSNSHKNLMKPKRDDFCSLRIINSIT